MRIPFKKLRYTLEFFAPQFLLRHPKPYLATLSRLQEEVVLTDDHINTEALISHALHDLPIRAIHGWIFGQHALLINQLS